MLECLLPHHRHAVAQTNADYLGLAKRGSFKTSNSVYTDTGVRITIDIDDAGYSSKSSLFSVIWTFGRQYNNSNMPDVRASAMTASESLIVCPVMAGSGQTFHL